MCTTPTVHLIYLSCYISNSFPVFDVVAEEIHQIEVFLFRFSPASMTALTFIHDLLVFCVLVPQILPTIFQDIPSSILKKTADCNPG
jgi:hypothetical protein